MGWVTYGSSRLILVGLGNLRFLQVNCPVQVDRGVQKWVKSAHLIPSISLHEDGLIFCSKLKKSIWFRHRRARQIEWCYLFWRAKENCHSNFFFAVVQFVLQLCHVFCSCALSFADVLHLFSRIRVIYNQNPIMHNRWEWVIIYNWRKRVPTIFSPFLFSAPFLL